MKIERNFEQLLEVAPDIIRNKIIALKRMRERPEFHPEPNVYEHIKIVTERLIPTNDSDLIMTALLHDICKKECAIIHPEKGYVKTPGHEKLALDFIDENANVQEFIKEMGANVETVKGLCKDHMRIKLLDIMRPYKVKKMEALPYFEKLLIFRSADDMIGRW